MKIIQFLKSFINNRIERVKLLLIEEDINKNKMIFNSE